MEDGEDDAHFVSFVCFKLQSLGWVGCVVASVDTVLLIDSTCLRTETA